MNKNYSSLVTSVEDIEETEIEWLIPYWIPKGAITLMAGEGGTGKTNIWSYIVSRLSCGLPTMLDNEGADRTAGPGNIAKIDEENQVIYEKINTTCLYFSKEDSTSKRLKGNFTQYEANMRNIKTIDIEDLAGFDYATDELEKLIENEKPALVVFDPIQAFFPSGTSMSSRQQSRRALDRLVQMGQKYNTAFLLVCHTNKKKTDDWREKISGSADLPDIARSVIFVGTTEIKAKKAIRFISNEKNSYAKPEDTVLYTIDDEGMVRFVGMSEKKFADYALEGRFVPGMDKGTLKENCKALILETLNEQGEMSVKELNEVIAEAGFSIKTGSSAKTELVEEGKMERERVKIEKGSEWRVRLPKKETDTPAAENGKLL